MTSDTRDDSPHSAPTDALQRPALRWVIVVVALLVLALVGYKAVHWFSDQDSAANADEAQTQAEGSAITPSEAATGDQPKPAPVAPAVVGRTVRPPQAKAPAARTTAQGDATNPCVVGGQVTYTNAPCPEGTAVGRADAGVGVVNAGAAPGLAAGGLPPGIFVGADPSQKDAECRFLTAEITRLDYEFKQPLPPPVLDQISGRLRERRERAASLSCAPAKAVDAADKKAAAPKPKPKPKPKPVLVEEKEGD